MQEQAAKHFIMTEQLWHALDESYMELARDSGFEVCRERWRFYYDETGNYRRIAYKDGAVPDARSVERDFIVGGLVFTSDAAVERAISLARSLPAPQGELKSRTILGKSKDISKTLGRKAVSRYLDVLDDEETFVHYSAQNNLYFSIVDIVDSLLCFDINRSLVNMHRELKNVLFNALRDNPKGSLDRLSRYGYPNVVGQDVGSFCRYLRDEVASGLTEELASEDPWAWFAAETLRQMLKAAEKERQLIFLEGNKSDELVGDFTYNFMQGCHVFPESRHVFDMETTVMRTLGQKANNYEFVDSKACVPVQLSDVFVGLLGRLFTYLDGLDASTIESEIGRFEGDSLPNLSRIRSAIYRASAKHVALIHNVNANSVLWWREEALAFLCDGWSC